jgi:hypothetical protein
MGSGQGNGTDIAGHNPSVKFQVLQRSRGSVFGRIGLCLLSA